MLFDAHFIIAGVQKIKILHIVLICGILQKKTANPACCGQSGRLSAFSAGNGFTGSDGRFVVSSLSSSNRMRRPARPFTISVHRMIRSREA